MVLGLQLPAPPQSSWRAMGFRPGPDSSGLWGGQDGKGLWALLTMWSPWRGLTAQRPTLWPPALLSRGLSFGLTGQRSQAEGTFAGFLPLKTLIPDSSRTQFALSCYIFAVSLICLIFWLGGVGVFGLFFCITEKISPDHKNRNVSGESR